MKLTDDELDALLKRLHLANARKIWQKLVERAEKEEWSYRDFLALLVAEEIAQRQQTRLGRLSHRARFPCSPILPSRKRRSSRPSARVRRSNGSSGAPPPPIRASRSRAPTIGPNTRSEGRTCTAARWIP